MTMVDTHMHYGNLCPQTIMDFHTINLTMSGTNYFAASGESVMDILSSALTITGNLTVCGAYSNDNQGGGINLDESSTLFLKEPLEARFCNNRAIQGSAIYAPGQSPMEILPNRIYTLDNITDMKVALYFENNTNYLSVPNSLYAPSLFSEQKSQNLKFSYHSADAYIILFDAIMKENVKGRQIHIYPKWSMLAASYMVLERNGTVPI